MNEKPFGGVIPGSDPLPGFAVIRRSQECGLSISVGSLVEVEGSTSHIDLSRSLGIDSNCLDAQKPGLVRTDPIRQGGPLLVGLIPPVGSTNVRASVEQILFDGRGDDARDKPTASDGHVVPGEPAPGTGSACRTYPA